MELRRDEFIYLPWFLVELQLQINILFPWYHMSIYFHGC